MPETFLTVCLSEEDAAFLKSYAARHSLGVSQVINRYVRRLREAQKETPRETLATVTGLVPEDIDAESVALEGQVQKHSGKPIP
ncbi:hypothetical protein PC39_16181 [Salinisphaera sp. PC39]